MDFKDLNRLFSYVKSLVEDDDVQPVGTSPAVDPFVNEPTKHPHLADPPSTQAESITLKIFGLDGSTIRFKAKKETPLGRLFAKYCDTIGITKEATRFRFDGLAVRDSDTPSTLEMVEDDIIEVYWRQIGGGNETIDPSSGESPSPSEAASSSEEKPSSSGETLKMGLYVPPAARPNLTHPPLPEGNRRWLKAGHSKLHRPMYSLGGEIMPRDH